MTDIAELGLAIRSDGVVVATDRLKDFEGAAGGAEAGAGRLIKIAGRMAGAFAAAISVSKMGQMADAWSDMQSRVGAAIKDMAAAPQMMQRLVQMANASYSPLEQTAEIFARNVGVLKALGLNADQAADYTESLNHMLVITATKGERAASVQNALSKAMAVGKLTGDGLETVLANGGRVAEALAEALGTNVNGLRKFAAEGRITSGVIAGALLTSLRDVRAEAAEMPATMGDAFTRVTTNLTALVGTLDQMLGVSGGVATAILFLADHIQELASYAMAAGLAVAGYYTPAVIAAVWQTGAWILELITLRGVLVSLGIGAFIVLVGSLINYIIDLAAKLGGLSGAFEYLGKVANRVWLLMVSEFKNALAEMLMALQGFMNAFTQNLGSLSINGKKVLDIGFGFSGFNDSIAGLMSSSNDALEAAMALGDELDSIKAKLSDTGSPQASPFDIADLGGGGGGGGKGGGKDQYGSKLTALVESLQTERETLDAWYQENLAILNDRRAQEILGIELFNATKEALEQEHQNRLRGIIEQERSVRLGEASSMFSGLAAIAEGAGKRALRFQAGLSAAATMISAYETAMKAAAEAKTIPGRIAAYAHFLGTGLKAAASIRSIGGASGGGSSGGGASSAAAAGAQAAPPRPQDVILDFTAFDAALKPLAKALAGPMIEQFQKVSKTGVNVVGVKY